MKKVEKNYSLDFIEKFINLVNESFVKKYKASHNFSNYMYCWDVVRYNYVISLLEDADFFNDDIDEESEKEIGEYIDYIKETFNKLSVDEEYKKCIRKIKSMTINE